MKIMHWLPQAVASIVAYRYTESSMLMLKRGARDLGMLSLAWLVAALCALAGVVFLMGAIFLWLDQRLDTPVAALIMAAILGALSGLMIWGMIGTSRRSIKTQYALGK